MRTKPYRPKINVITLGCSKNMVDSEVLMGQLKANDFRVSHEREKNDSEIVIINTCGFIDRAKEESINTILEYASIKNEGVIDKLYVTGCLSERYKSQLEEEIPEVDAYFGTMELPSLLHKLGANYKDELLGERFLITPQHYAYLKISEGCNRTCSFCAIPLMRGKHVSKPLEVVVAEAQTLVKRGVKEIMLIAQESTYYGLDIYKERKLAQLLMSLSSIDGLGWIRLHYAYPSKFPTDILDVISEKKNICNYLDMPLQHVSNNMLRRMKRQISKEEIEDLIETIRKKIPAIGLRTTMLVGFPGETEDDVDELISFLEKMQFDRVGVFTYSHEENTSAYKMRDAIPEKIKHERAARVMAAQERISIALNQEKVGKTLKVLIDRREGNYFVGRTEYDSPEVDNEVLIDASTGSLQVGEFYMVNINGAEAFDLYATPVYS